MTGFGGETSLLFTKAVGAGEAETRKGANEKTKNAACPRAWREGIAGLMVFFFTASRPRLGNGEIRESVVVDYLYLNHHPRSLGRDRI
jgi:hypothetical protein